MDPTSGSDAGPPGVGTDSASRFVGDRCQPGVVRALCDSPGVCERHHLLSVFANTGADESALLARPVIGRRIERKPLALVWADAPADHHLAAVDLYRRPREREVRHEEHASLVRAAIDHLMCAWLPAGKWMQSPGRSSRSPSGLRNVGLPATPTNSSSLPNS